MTTNEIKDILAAKLKEEGTYFTKSHIKLKRNKKGYTIVIDDYTHIPFKVVMTQEDGEYWTIIYADTECISFETSKYEYKEFSAILRIGYYAGTRF